MKVKRLRIVALMSNGSAYVNIHTDQYLDGEFRGQLVMGQIQMDGNAITGLAVPGGLLKLGGISLQGGSISFSLGSPGFIMGFLPTPVGTGPQTGTGIGNTVEIGNGDTVESVAEGVDGVVDKVGGIAEKTVDQLSGTAGDNVDNTIQKIDEGIVKKILGDDSDDSDSRDSDDSDSRDSDDSDSRDSDDSDSRDSDDDEDDDSLKDKVTGLLD